MAPGIGVLPLPDGFRPYLGPVLGKMIIKTTTGCQWEMSVKEVSGKAILEAGWPEFAITHNLKIGYLLFFKKLTTREYRVVVFDYSCCEVVGRCPEHPRSMRRLQRMRSDQRYVFLLMFVMLPCGWVKNIWY
jgi:hypothetical protein